MELERSEAQRARRDAAEGFGRDEIASSVAARDRASTWDPALFLRMGERGLLGAALPAEHGGGGLGALDVASLLEGFAAGSGDAGLALAWTVHSLLCGVPIARLGTEAQRRRHLAGMVRGDRVGAVAHHERDAGSDPASIATRAVRAGDGFRLTGTKASVINGPVAQLFLVTAVTDPTRGAAGISMFVVERDAPGVSLSAPPPRIGLRTAPVCDVVLDDCEVSASDLLGAEGRGLLDGHRLIQRWQRGALCMPWIGLLQSLLERSTAHARARRQFGRPIGDFQAVRVILADMKIQLELARRLQARAAWQLDRDDPDGDRDVAQAQLLISEWAQRAARDALQLHGEQGLGGDELVERLFRDAAALGVVAGSNDLLRSVLGGALLGLG